MNNITNSPAQPMHIGEKIRQIRVSKGLSQENVANAVGRSIAAISRFESGEVAHNELVLANIKKYMDIENVPLFDHELEVYRNQLWALDDLICSQRWTEANALLDKLAVILDLPFEGELFVMYKLIISRILLADDKFSEAEENLIAAESFINNTITNHDVLYLYYRLKGLRYIYSVDYENSRANYLKALEHGNNRVDCDILYRIGAVSMMLGESINAIEYFERAKHNKRNWCYEIELSIEIDLAYCYYMIFQFKKAKELYESALAKARAYNNVSANGSLLSDLSAFYFQIGSYAECNRYVDEALIALESASNSDLQKNTRYITTLIIKAKCLVELKDYNTCEGLLKQAETLAEGNERFITEIDATRHLMALINDNKHPVEYLVDVAIPYYRSKVPDGPMYALYLCEILERHYRKKGSKRKADDIAVIGRDIYRDIIHGWRE